MNNFFYQFELHEDALIYIRSKDDDKLNTQFTKEEFIPVWNNFTSALEKYRVFIKTRIRHFKWFSN